MFDCPPHGSLPYSLSIMHSRVTRLVVSVSTSLSLTLLSLVILRTSAKCVRLPSTRKSSLFILYHAQQSHATCGISQDFTVTHFTQSSNFAHFCKVCSIALHTEVFPIHSLSCTAESRDLWYQSVLHCHSLYSV